jgi:hypothetical protein
MLDGRFPQRIKRLAGKARNYNSNSSPFLSGDSFADLCDFHFQPPQFRRLLQRTHIEQAKTLFCPSHLLEEFLSIYGDRIAGQVLIIGNSDRDFDGFELPLPRSIRTVFIQNLSFKSDLLRALPIGIENLRLNFNGRPENFDNKYVIRQKENRILIGPFALSHPERNFINELKKYDRSKLEVNQDRLSPLQYAELSSKFKFVACPRGNGVDTHRFWETLYRGSIPVIKSSEWSKNLKVLGLPYIEIKDWDEENIYRIPELSRAELFNPSAIETLWMPFWENTIQSLIKN